MKSKTSTLFGLLFALFMSSLSAQEFDIFVSDAALYKAHLKELSLVHRKYFGKYYPVTALFEITGFYQEHNLVEIEGIAYLEGDVIGLSGFNADSKTIEYY